MRLYKNLNIVYSFLDIMNENNQEMGRPSVGSDANINLFNDEDWDTDIEEERKINVNA